MDHKDLDVWKKSMDLVVNAIFNCGTIIIY